MDELPVKCQLIYTLFIFVDFSNLIFYNNNNVIIWHVTQLKIYGNTEERL